MNQQTSAMYHKTIFHTLSDGTKVKFTIRERSIHGEKYYYANVVDTEMESYKSLPEDEKETHYGIELTDSNHNSINYADPVRLLNDMLIKYGKEWMQSEI